MLLSLFFSSVCWHLACSSNHENFVTHLEQFILPIFNGGENSFFFFFFLSQRRDVFVPWKFSSVYKCELYSEQVGPRKEIGLMCNIIVQVDHFVKHDLIYLIDRSGCFLQEVGISEAVAKFSSVIYCSLIWNVICI